MVEVNIVDLKPSDDNLKQNEKQVPSTVPTLVFYPEGRDWRVPANWIASVQAGGILRSELSSTSKRVHVYIGVDVQQSSCSDKYGVQIKFDDQWILVEFLGGEKVMYFIDSTVRYITPEAHENDNI